MTKMSNFILEKKFEQKMNKIQEIRFLPKCWNYYANLVFKWELFTFSKQSK